MPFESPFSSLHKAIPRHFPRFLSFKYCLKSIAFYLNMSNCVEKNFVMQKDCTFGHFLCIDFSGETGRYMFLTKINLPVLHLKDCY